MSLACGVLLLGLVCGANQAARASAVAPSPLTISGVYSPLQAESDVYLIYSYDYYGTPETPQVALLAASEPLGATPFAVNFSEYTVGTITDQQIAVFSVYNVPSNLVTVSLGAAGAATATGEAFATYFSGGNETTLATALENGTTATIGSFYTSYIADFPIIAGNLASGVLINFSNGAPGGMLTITSVPEPSTWALLLLGGGGLGLGLLARRRRGAGAV
jgi:hypothetical protein